MDKIVLAIGNLPHMDFDEFILQMDKYCKDANSILINGTSNLSLMIKEYACLRKLDYHLVSFSTDSAFIDYAFSLSDNVSVLSFYNGKDEIEKYYDCYKEMNSIYHKLPIRIVSTKSILGLIKKIEATDDIK